MNTLVIARNTLQDSLRRRVIVVFLALGIVMLALAILLRFITVADRSALLAETQLFIILVFGGLIAITTSVFLIPQEIERRTVYGVLSKPVLRWQFFVGKFLGGVLTVGVMTGVMMVVLLLALFIFAAIPSGDAGGRSGMGSAVAAVVPVLRGCASIYFQLVIVTAVATTLSLFLTATVNFSVSTFIWILGSLQWLLSSLANRQDQNLVIIPWILKAFYYITPHFHDINVMGDVVKPEVPIKMNPYFFAGGVVLYGLIYALIVLFVGILAFERKEV